VASTRWLLFAGAPCDNFKGYCDVFQKCRAVNEDGPLARLKNLLFSQQTYNHVKAWITVKMLASLQWLYVNINVLICITGVPPNELGTLVRCKQKCL